MPPTPTATATLRAFREVGEAVVLTSDEATCLPTFAAPTFGASKLACQPAGTVARLTEGPFEVYEPQGNNVWWGLSIGGYTVERWMREPSAEAKARVECTRTVDVREVDASPYSFIGQPCFTMTGTVLTVHDAGEGYVFTPEIRGRDGDIEVQVRVTMQLDVLKPNASSIYDTVTLIVVTNVPIKGVFEDVSITIWGAVIGTETFVNTLGGNVTQPVIQADAITVN